MGSWTADHHPSIPPGESAGDLTFDLLLQGFPATLFRALMAGSIDLMATPLHLLPAHLPEGIVITALSARPDAAWGLLFRPGLSPAKKTFRLPEGARVGLSSKLAHLQLLDFRPDVQPVLLDTLPALPLSEELEALLLPMASLPPGQEALRLNPKEFIPAPGQGVTAYLTLKDDLPVRRRLKPLHHSKVSACTNVERRLLQLAAEHDRPLLGAYCEQDAAGHFHFWTVLPGQEGEPQYTRRSSSTNFRLAEQVWGEL